MSRAAARAPTGFRVASVLLLLWGVSGVLAYLSQVTMGAAELARLPRAQAELWAMLPGWVTALYAVAVWTGLAGAIALLLRRRLALPAYLVSLTAATIQFGWVFTATPILRTIGWGAAGFPLLILAVGLFALWLSARAHRRGWLR